MFERSKMSRASKDSRIRTQGTRSIISNQKPNRGNSLLQFQDELHHIITKKRSEQKFRDDFKIRRKKPKRLQTSLAKYSQTQHLKTEISDLKGKVQSHLVMNKMENKIERLLLEIETLNKKNSQQPVIKQTERPQQQNPIYFPQPHVIYPPQLSPIYRQYESHREPKRKRRKHEQSEQQSSEQEVKHKKKFTHLPYLQTKKNMIAAKKEPIKVRKRKIKLRKVVHCISFIFFLQKYAKKSIESRKHKTKMFIKQSFHKQITIMKNWLVETQKFPITILLEKAMLDFKFFQQNSKKIRVQAERLIMDLVEKGLKQMEKSSSYEKVYHFIQILVYLCRNGSMVVDNFWSQFEMKNICISEKYGILRLDNTLQQYMIGLLVIIKMLIFNMMLQPYKFDNQNFPKNKQPLTTNLRLVGSVYYLLAKEVFEQLIQEERSTAIFPLGNWKKLTNRHKLSFCSPLVFGDSDIDLQQGQYISGLFGEQSLSSLRKYRKWQQNKQTIRSIIKKFQEHVHKKHKHDKSPQEGSDIFF